MDKTKLKQYLKYIGLNVLIAAVISILLINYVAAAYKIKGHSMLPNLKDKERIIIYKWGIKSGLERFDIIVLNKPDSPNRTIIKRVIGLPGETVEIKEGEVYIDNIKIDQPFLSPNKNVFFKRIHMAPLKIRDGHYFVLGDNRVVSRDSRSFGTVPTNIIRGKAALRYWPPGRIGKVL
ncbi:MAG: signal peptidase I [bacterium]|nr:signal peptidase I [bacterium]